MFRPLKHALAALLLLCAPLAHAADIKPLINSSGSIRPVHTGETVGVANGGTGATTLTAHCVILGNGTTAPTVACPGSSGNVLTSNGSSADPTFQASSASPAGTSGQIQYNNSGAFGGFTASGDVTINTSTGVTAIGSNKVTLGMVAQSGANTMLGNWSGSTANVAANSMPSCADSAGNHLNYVAGTGITCGTTSSASGGGSTTLIGTGGTFYVNHSTGSDSNNCTSSGTACLTIAHALSLVPPILTAAYTVNVADGTYAECLSIGPFFSPFDANYLTITGNTTTPANVLITGQCSFAGIGTQTAGAFIQANAPILIQGVKVAPTSASTYGLMNPSPARVYLSNVTIGGALTNGIGVFHNGIVAVDNTVAITGWTNFGVFAGLHGEFDHSAGTGTLTLTLTPATAGVSCLHAEMTAQMDLEGSGTIACPGGSANATTFLDGDTNASIFITLPSTAINSSTPANSQIFAAYHGANVFLLATITATKWTNSCSAHEGGSADQGVGGRTFTTVGATNAVNTGTCILF